MSPSTNRSSRNRRKVQSLGALVALGCLGFVAACEESPTQVAADVPEPQFTHKGNHKGPKPSDPAVPLRITVVSGAFTGDDVDDVYDETNGAAPHLSGVNGNLMFDLRESVRLVHVTAEDSDGMALGFDAKTRTFTNNGPDPVLGLKTGMDGSAVLESEWRTTESDGKFFYSLRYGKDCDGKVSPEGDATPKAAVTFDGTSSTWTIIGVSGLLCRKKQKGKPGLSPVGSAGVFEMTLVDITPPPPE